jgi:Ca2+-binding EF-hand superfamily protein
MKLKTLLIGAAAMSALTVVASAQAWAGGQSAPTETHKEIIRDDHSDGHTHHCHVRIVTGDGGEGGGAMEAMHRAMSEHGGVVTREEFLALHTALFDKLDLNHDGKLEPDEIAAAHGGPDHGGPEHNVQVEDHDVDCAQALRDREHDAEGPTGPGRHSVQVTRSIEDRADFEAMDANHDGRISFDEFSARLREAFNEFDTDHSGYLEKSEWPTGREIEIRRETDGGKP